jgi:hypothetical protein
VSTLDRKVAIVTGARRGLGRSHVLIGTVKGVRFVQRLQMWQPVASIEKNRPWPLDDAGTRVSGLSQNASSKLSPLG